LVEPIGRVSPDLPLPLAYDIHHPLVMVPQLKQPVINPAGLVI
jgi:hypothetical protein